MTRFQRPVGAIEDARDLKSGDHLWRVIGIWPPFVGGEYVITWGPAPFSEHARYSHIHAGAADHLVFDTRELKHQFVDMNFAGDGNLIPGHSSNDNYWFRTQEEAEAARAHLHAEWKRNPEMIEEEIERRRDRAHYDRAYG